MKVLVTGSAGHLGEALVRALRSRNDEVVALDLLSSPFTTHVGSITDRSLTSTTSVFGDALIPPSGEPAAWITEEVRPVPKNIYGATKAAAEDLCQLFHRNEGLPCLVLRTSRFFPEADDNREIRESYADDNLKANEFLYRRVGMAKAPSLENPWPRRSSRPKPVSAQGPTE